MAQHAKPSQYHVLKGNPGHKTKAELEDREANEIKIGTRVFGPLPAVKTDRVATRHWKKLKELYKDFTFVSSADSNTVSEYCLAMSDYEGLVMERRHVADFETDSVFDADDYPDVLEDEWSKQAAKKFFDKVHYVASLTGLLAVDKAINSKLATIKGLSDVLFLNPASRIKHVAARGSDDKKRDKTEAEKSGFGHVS